MEQPNTNNIVAHVQMVTAQLEGQCSNRPPQLATRCRIKIFGKTELHPSQIFSNIRDVSGFGKKPLHTQLTSVFLFSNSVSTIRVQQEHAALSLSCNHENTSLELCSCACRFCVAVFLNCVHGECNGTTIEST